MGSKDSQCQSAKRPRHLDACNVQVKVYASPLTAQGGVESKCGFAILRFVQESGFDDPATAILLTMPLCTADP